MPIRLILETSCAYVRVWAMRTLRIGEVNGARQVHGPWLIFALFCFARSALAIDRRRFRQLFFYLFISKSRDEQTTFTQSNLPAWAPADIYAEVTFFAIPAEN